ncbi:hypothetical protein pb186bvf_020922 [Paramecium bursaria]
MCQQTQTDYINQGSLNMCPDIQFRVLHEQIQPKLYLSQTLLVISNSTFLLILNWLSYLLRYCWHITKIFNKEKYYKFSENDTILTKFYFYALYLSISAQLQYCYHYISMIQYIKDQIRIFIYLYQSIDGNIRYIQFSLNNLWWIQLQFVFSIVKILIKESNTKLLVLLINSSISFSDIGRKISHLLQISFFKNYNYIRKELQSLKKFKITIYFKAKHLLKLRNYQKLQKTQSLIILHCFRFQYEIFKKQQVLSLNSNKDYDSHSFLQIRNEYDLNWNLQRTSYVILLIYELICSNTWSFYTIVHLLLTLNDFPLVISICGNISALSDTPLQAFFKFGILLIVTGLENFYFSEMLCVYFCLVSLMVIKSEIRFYLKAVWKSGLDEVGWNDQQSYFLELKL